MEKALSLAGTAFWLALMAAMGILAIVILPLALLHFAVIYAVLRSLAFLIVFFLDLPKSVVKLSRKLF